ncbi:hypothetical protein ACH5RR_000540 [Cinchona calisaya]|uniref:MADS-box domain-containing protein n=1 Tax=Cinchona calisaya TaxID=153742 RepID=A0ABD3B126_9GENT
MTGRKIKPASITNQDEQKVSYKKKRKILMKKVEELNTLRGVEACAIVKGPYDNEPEMWPPSRQAVQSVLSRFKTRLDMEKLKQMKDQLKKLEMDNRDKEIAHFIHMCFRGEGITNLSIADRNDIVKAIDWNLEKIKQRLSLLKKDMPQPPALNIHLETSPGVDNQDSITAPEMTTIAIDKQDSLVAPEITITKIDNQSSLVTPEMPMSRDVQSLTSGLDMLRVNEPKKLDEFHVDD